MLENERRLWTAGYERVAGLDEAGRGCLAGPVLAAAVVFSPETELAVIQDSKALSEPERLEAREQIEQEAEAFAIAKCSPEEIDELNILQAALKAMRQAASDCHPSPDFLLIDGNQWSRTLTEAPWPYETVIKGDAKSQTIAAASVLAKTERDELMRRLHEEHPEYSWNTNVGYATQQHYNALAEHGATPYHRESFTLFRE